MIPPGARPPGERRGCPQPTGVEDSGRVSEVPPRARRFRPSVWVRVPVALGVALLVAVCSGSPKDGATGAVRLPSSPTALPQFTAAQFHDLLSSLRGKP